MNKLNYKKILLTIFLLLPIFLLTPSKAAKASANYNFNFSDLTYESNRNASHWAANNSQIILLNGQNTEIDYSLPQAIDIKDCSSITYNASSPSGKTAIKFYNAANEEVGVKYDITSNGNTDFVINSPITNSKVSTVITKIGITNMESWSCCVIANSLSFNMNEINEKQKLAAITFDDGPSTKTTPQILDILEKHNTKATFFLIGSQINNNTIPIMKKELSLNCEIANHSWSHSYMNKMSADKVKNEVESTSNAIKNAVGVEPKFFRPPYIALSTTMYDNINLGFICGMGCNDWDSSYSADYRVETVLNNVSDGTIILLHDFAGNNNTVEALPRIIEGLKEKGYKLVTVSELFKEKGVNPLQKNKIWTTVK